MTDRSLIWNRVKAYLIIASWTLVGVLVFWFVTIRSQVGVRFNWPLILGLAMGVIYFIAVFWEFPKSQISSLSVPPQELKGRFELENEARRTVAQIIGGLAILITLFHYRNLKSIARTACTCAGRTACRTDDEGVFVVC
jgi:hypothetical protein